LGVYGSANLHKLILVISSTEIVETIASYMPSTGYIGLFAILMIENTSVPLPGEFFLPLAGYYVFVGRMSFLGVLTLSSIASLLGSLVVFSLALKFGAPLVYWWVTKLGIGQRSLAKNEIRLCGKYGSAIILLSRFIPIFGSAIVLPAGALRMNPLRFASLSLVGSLASTATYLFLGYSVGPFLQRYEILLSGLAVRNALFALAIAGAAYLAYYSLRKLKRERAETVFIKKISS